MTASQYKNIIQWTLYLHPDLEKGDCQKSTRKLFDNLGVAFPQGDFEEILPVLKSNAFMGWRSCSAADARKFADLGIPTIGIDGDRAVLILPSEQIQNLSADSAVEKAKSMHVKIAAEFSAEECTHTCFFTYSYGYEPQEN